MTIQRMINKLLGHSEARRIGMVATHLGIVRGMSLDGRDIEEIEVSYNSGKVNEIVNEIKATPGIVDVLVEYFEGRLDVGDEILAVAVAGETRLDVFPVLVQTVDRIKAEAVHKTEYFREGAE